MSLKNFAGLNGLKKIQESPKIVNDHSKLIVYNSLGDFIQSDHKKFFGCN